MRSDLVRSPWRIPAMLAAAGVLLITPARGTQDRLGSTWVVPR
jgi:hypothetical protein